MPARLMFAVIEVRDDENATDQDDMALYLDAVASGESDYEYTVYQSLNDLQDDLKDGVFGARDVEPRVGEMGLSFNEVGSIVQSMARCIVDREAYTKEEVLKALEDFDEMVFWDHVGGCIDELEATLFPPPERCVRCGSPEGSTGRCTNADCSRWEGPDPH